jgi:hypothetical protein
MLLNCEFIKLINTLKEYKMAGTIRVSGTISTNPTPGASYNITAPDGSVVISSSNTTIVSTSPTGKFTIQTPSVQLTSPTQSYSSQTGALTVAGGVGIEKDLWVGGVIHGIIENAFTSSLMVVTATNIDSVFYPVFVDQLGVGRQMRGDNTGEGTDTLRGLTYNPARGLLRADKMFVSASTASTSPITGAFTVTGGVGILGDVNLGSNLTVAGNANPEQNLMSNLGNTATQWAESYLNKIYTQFIASTASNIQIAPEGGVTEIIGDIRVRGTKPIGTAPVVTNVLYVTMDGDDTNDGRAQDASRACRTITGAVNSPYYQPGTQIRVSPGHYLEDNPIQLKPYTSIMGSDIRTTGVEPINKTQDLFHMNSGCYLAFMQFLNGRSGLLEGAYDSKFNRGAYCTAFPPLTGDDRIDLYHSPYIQNCTNLSGPWLKDGTLFTPNQTVQVPSAVGTGTWASNTTSIVVNVSAGTIKQGDYINAGQQNPGFFNARTLLLANKPFLQEQVVKHVNYYYPTFVYNQEKCFRDVGILLENAAYDAAFGGNEKSVESGLSYFNGVVSVIAGQEEQTTYAINYLRDRCLEVITNTPCTNLIAGTRSQVINTALTDGAVSSDSITNLFGIVTTIINNGPSAAPSVYKSTGPDAAFVSAEILMQANRAFMQEDTINYINYNLCVPPKVLPYNKIKCKRDVGLIVDSVAFDLLYPTATHSQTTFAGLQYWNQNGYVGAIAGELTTTTAAVSYLRDLAVKIIQNITPADDLVDRYQTSTPQDTSMEAATLDEAAIIKKNFNIILDILGGDSLGWSDKIIPNGLASEFLSVQNAVAILQANIPYMKAEVIAYIDTLNVGFLDAHLARIKCIRDIGYMIDSVAFDLLHGGNRQSVQSGLAYYGADAGTITIQAEEVATTDAFTYLATIAGDIVQNNKITPLQSRVKQNTSLTPATSAEATLIARAVSTVTNIINNGPVGQVYSPITLTASGSATVADAFNILLANREFIQAEVVAYVDKTYNPDSFSYDEELCYRDTGLLIDAVSQDILLGGNSKSIEAGLAYWNQGYNYVAGQESTTTMAINHIKDIALQIIANQEVTPQPGTLSTQIINHFFDYGGDYMPQEAVSRNFNIITTIIQDGPQYAPPVYQGGGIFALTGINGLDVKTAPQVTSVSEISTGKYLIGLNTRTIGFGTNSTLYFGDTLVFPKQDFEVEELSLELTGYANTWNSRKVDPIGGMGGSLVDGAVVSARSPIQSFVYDAFTQLTQGGHGVKITNDGYAQLVSVFTIFSSVGVQVTNGGIASIVNSNANFGDVCLLAKGYGERKFSGTIYNPVFKAYPKGTDLDQYYPAGYWPNNARVEVFLPDTGDRPHISLVMEVLPPDGHTNEQGLPGFLNAIPNLATLNTGTITITGINTDGIAIGNALYIRDQFGKTTSTNGTPYVAEGTVVTDLGYQSVTLNYALTSGGGEVGNPNFFNLYFCGNSYYTVLSSEVAENPKTAGLNLLSAAITGGTDQITQHISALEHLNIIVNQVIRNTTVTRMSTAEQTKLPLVTGGGAAQTFIDLRFGEMISIFGAADLAAAEAVIPVKLRTKTGPAVQGAGSAITLIKANIDFMAAEILAYITGDIGSGGLDFTNFNQDKCKRDIKIILQRLIYDIETGGRYNTVMNGLSYWSRDATHHLVSLGENVRRTDLFPDGATVNFYQRSYISASGYVFEYVGAGTNYGALPQFGIADPVQGKETVQLGSGKVFFTSTDQNGDFRIGPGLVISQATGVLSGRTFTKSLFANMTPFILAIEGGAL